MGYENSNAGKVAGNNLRERAADLFFFFFLPDLGVFFDVVGFTRETPGVVLNMITQKLLDRTQHFTSSGDASDPATLNIIDTIFCTHSNVVFQVNQAPLTNPTGLSPHHPILIPPVFPAPIPKVKSLILITIPIATQSRTILPRLPAPHRMPHLHITLRCHFNYVSLPLLHPTAFEEIHPLCPLLSQSRILSLYQSISLLSPPSTTSTPLLGVRPCRQSSRYTLNSSFPLLPADT
jgi:hypothetical protein